MSVSYEKDAKVFYFLVYIYLWNVQLKTYINGLLRLYLDHETAD